MKFQVVGMTGLEPATSRPPAVRATKLRHIPELKSILQIPLEVCDSSRKCKVDARSYSPRGAAI